MIEAPFACMSFMLYESSLKLLTMEMYEDSSIKFYEIRFQLACLLALTRLYKQHDVTRKKIKKSSN